PSSGIWQTVWLEAVPQIYIQDLKITPDIDAQTLHLTVDAPNAEQVQANVSGNGANISHTAKPGTDLQIHIAKPVLWSPDNPTLYDLKVTITDASGKTVDSVTSYFGMRKIS